MCGRYTLRTASNDLIKVFQFADSGFDLTPRYNIAPTQDVAAVRWNAEHDQRELTFLHWGLIPFWAKDAKIGGRMINARAETIAEKPSFRHAFLKKRCLILADGFYEWQKLAGGTKQPFYIHRQDDEPFALAGLWETWKNAGQIIESCTIITTTANETMQPLHDRMPVILSSNDYGRWLDPQFQAKAALEELLKPCPADLLEAYPVSTLVNNARNEKAQCMERRE